MNQILIETIKGVICILLLGAVALLFPNKWVDRIYNRLELKEDKKDDGELHSLRK